MKTRLLRWLRRYNTIKELIEAYALDAMERYNSKNEDADYWLGKYTACVDLLDIISKKV